MTWTNHLTWRRISLLMSVATAPVAAMPASAQTTAPVASQAAAPATTSTASVAAQDQADAQTAGPADIIVTATRRAESIQTVPLSVTAVTGQSLQQNNVHDLTRVDVLVPGFKFGASGNDARPAIRGTRTQQVVGNADPLVAFYNDGIYRSRPSQALSTFLDVERVEILRGPQGTLFGRNSFGGAINVISRAPKLGQLDFGGMVEVTNYQGLRVEGFVNLPVGDKVAIRISGYDSRRDGWVHNTTNTSNDLHDDRNQVVRAQIKFEPSSNFTNTFRAEYWHGGGAGGGDYGYFTPGVPVNPATGFTNGVTGVINPVISAGTVNNPLVAGNPAYDGGYGGLIPGTLGDADYKHIQRNFPQIRRINQLTLSDEATLGLGDFADLKGILSYTHYKEYRQADPDYTAQRLNYENGPVKVVTYTEEVQLASKPGQRLSWVAGVYLLQDKPRGGFNFGTDTGGVPVQLYSADPTGYFSGPDGSYTDSYAAYADGTYKLADWLRVLGGVRYTKDKKRGYVNPNAGTTTAPDTSITARASFSRVTYRGGFQVDVAPRAMVYGTYSTGYLSGGLNDSTPITRYEPTYSSAFEVGAKTTLLDGKLRANVALYRNRYRNIITQILRTLPNNAVVTTAANAGKIKAYGAEGELDYYPTREAYIGLRLAYNHSRFGPFIAPNSFHDGGNTNACNSNGAFCAFQVEGLQVPLNPTFSGTLLGSYDIDTGKVGVFTPSVTAFYSTKYRTSDQPFFFANQKRYGTVDAYLRWRPDADSRLSVEGFVNNLTDKRILLRTTPNGGEVIFQDFSNPRIYGVRASFNY